MRLPYLDIIRGGAELIVFCEHARSGLIVRYAELDVGKPRLGVLRLLAV